jgi:hypothetical protein
MATTTNYSWTTPDDTDLVKDGAAAIRTLGSSADTTVKNLNPGTTAGDIDYYTSATAKARVAIGTAGQVLKVNAGGTAPEWGTTADQTPLTTKGDLFTFDTADARLGVGANGTVLTADSGETTGLKWASPSATKTWTLLSTTAMNGVSSVTVSGISNKDDVLVLVVLGDTNTANDPVWFRINGDTASNYNVSNNSYKFATTYSSADFGSAGGSATHIPFGTFSSDAGSTLNGSVLITGCASTGVKYVSYNSGGSPSAGNGQISNSGAGVYNASAAVTNITVLSRFSNNFSGGNVLVYVA